MKMEEICFMTPVLLVKEKFLVTVCTYIAYY